MEQVGEGLIDFSFSIVFLLSLRKLSPKCSLKKEIKVEKHSKALKTQILVFANLMRLWQLCFTSHEELHIKEDNSPPLAKKVKGLT